MKLSKTSEYAIRILSYMARESEALFSAKNLVEKLNISDKYLRKLMTSLSKAQLISSTQGRYGGYRFDKNIKDIFVSDIINAVEGMDKYLGCILGFKNCSDECPCSMHSSWIESRKVLINTFNTTTLFEISKNEVKKT